MVLPSVSGCTHSFPFALSLLRGVSPAGQPGRSVTEHCISFWAGFPFSRTFWASQVQGKGEASSSCLQMGDEEEKRGASRGDGWAVGCQCHSQVPFVSAGCFLWVQITWPCLGQGASLPSALGGHHFPGPPRFLTLFLISGIPLSPSQKPLSGWKPFLQELWR